MTILFHGSPHLFDTFEVKRRATVSREVAEVPVFVTDQKDFARLHAGANGYLYTVDADLGRVFDADTLYDTSTRFWPPAPQDLTAEGEELWQSIFNGEIFPLEPVADEHEADQMFAAILKYNWDAVEDPSFIRWLRKHGYNSTRIRGEHTGNHFAVFDPDRVRILEVEPVNAKKLKARLLR